MPTTKRTISVRLDDAAKRRVERAAKLLKQSSGAFLEKVGDQQAREILLEWAAEQYRADSATFSQLADETGLAVEEIMLWIGKQNKDDALQMFLASCRTVAEITKNPDFLRVGEEAAQLVASERTAE